MKKSQKNQIIQKIQFNSNNSIKFTKLNFIKKNQIIQQTWYKYMKAVENTWETTSLRS